MRERVRLRAWERLTAFELAERQMSEKILPELKKFLNEQPLKDRIKVAWLIILGRF